MCSLTGTYNKAVHWAKYFFAKFYRHNDLEKYSYAVEPGRWMVSYSISH